MYQHIKASKKEKKRFPTYRCPSAALNVLRRPCFPLSRSTLINCGHAEPIICGFISFRRSPQKGQYHQCVPTCLSSSSQHDFNTMFSRYDDSVTNGDRATIPADFRSDSISKQVIITAGGLLNEYGVRWYWFSGIRFLWAACSSWSRSVNSTLAICCSCFTVFS